jgi:multidrug transporter EmrE-like cation transporter
LVQFSGWGGVSLAVTTGTCSVVALVSSNARQGLVRWAVGGAAAAAVLAFASALGAGSTCSGVAALIGVGLLAAAAAEVLGTVLMEREVGFRTILGAISVYVILGLLFTFVYAAIDRLEAGPFFQTATQTGDFMFFSVTTLTTTGYGNLIPVHQFGRMVAGLEMLVGQIFLVTLIAGLVSLWRPGAWERRRRSEG